MSGSSAPSGGIERCAIDSSAFVVRNRTDDRLTLVALIRHHTLGGFAQGRSGPAAVRSLPRPHGRVHDSFYPGRCGRLLFPFAKHNGDDSGELPLGATFVVDRKGVIRYAFLDADYGKWAEPSTVLAAIRGLHKKP